MRSHRYGVHFTVSIEAVPPPQTDIPRPVVRRSHKQILVNEALPAARVAWDRIFRTVGFDRRGEATITMTRIPVFAGTNAVSAAKNAVIALFVGKSAGFAPSIA